MLDTNSSAFEFSEMDRISDTRSLRLYKSHLLRLFLLLTSSVQIEARNITIDTGTDDPQDSSRGEGNTGSNTLKISDNGECLLPRAPVDRPLQTMKSQKAW